MELEDRILALLLEAFARKGDVCAGFHSTPPELHTLADYLSYEGDHRHDDVRELLAAPCQVPPMAPGRVLPMAAGTWWRIAIRSERDQFFTLMWWVRTQAPQWQAVARILPSTGHELVLQAHNIPSAFESIRFQLVAALLGRTMAELEARNALLSEDDDEVAHGLLLPNTPQAAVNELREQDSARYWRVRELATAYRQESCSGDWLETMYPYQDWDRLEHGSGRAVWCDGEGDDPAA